MKTLSSNSVDNPGSVWIIGLSSAGKSTLARMLVDRLRDNDYPCMLVDGDEVRAIFDERLGYDPASRRRQTQRILALTRWVSGHGILPIVAIIHPFEDDRQRCRATLEKYFEVYLCCELAECIRRDTKKVYQPAIDGKSQNVVGLDIPYDPPGTPDMTLNSTVLSPEEMLDILWNHIQQKILPNYQLRVIDNNL